MFPFQRVVRTQGAAAVLWGLILVVWPGALFSLLGTTTDDAGLLMGRFAGGMLFALGVTLFAIRDTADPAVRRTVAIANGVTDLVMAVVLLLAAVFGITSGFMAWMIVFFFALNTVSWLATTRET